MKREKLLNSLLRGAFVTGLIICQSIAVQAAPGDLDLTFGIGGKVTTSLFGYEYASAVAIQTDGK